MLADYLQDGHTVFEIFDLETGQYLETVPLPLSSAFLTSITVYSTEVFFTYESLIQPRTNVRLDYAQEREDGAPLKLEVIEKWKYGDFDSSKYETKQIFYETFRYSPMHKIRIQKGKQWPAILSLHILANPPVIRSNCGQNQEQKSKSQNYRVTFWSEMIPIVVLILFNPTPILASQATIAEVVSSLLLMTGDHDDRVSPWQTYKYIAQLYHVLSTKGAKIQKRPILARIEADVGHGACVFKVIWLKIMFFLAEPRCRNRSTKGSACTRFLDESLNSNGKIELNVI
ncbi:Prolyl endopeptidase-like protein [Aphelenchoides besseyi]|nr:Prolyl endopeptidase-like protein [Aphelenchoides besseyi]